MRKAIVLIVFAACNWNITSAQPSSRVDSLYSESLGRIMPFSVLLPSGYNPGSSYPVLYLFHGRGADYQTWISRSDIEEYIDIFPMVVVMPEGEMSFFINAYTEPKDRFEDYLIIDLQKYVNEKYSIDSVRQAIGGFSLGGYGAMTLALKHPGLFQYVISICGTISGVRDLEEIKTGPNIADLIPFLDRVFGKEPNDYRIAHDPFELYKEIPPEDLPYIFLINGIRDPNNGVVTGQREFASLLENHGAYYEYHEVPGRHGYESTGNAALNLVFQRMAYLKVKKPRSIANLLERKIADDGIAEAISWYNLAIKTTEDSPYYIDRNELNQLGYALINESKTEEAIAVFQLAIEAYPKSANLYDSISDAYIAKGDTAGAINAVKECIKLIPDDPFLSDDFALELKQIAEDKLKLFEGK